MKNFESLYAELVAKKDADPTTSATAHAVDEGVHFIGKKIVEEAAEVWMAGEYESDEELAGEISQLFYWAHVMMISRGLTPEDIFQQL